MLGCYPVLGMFNHKFIAGWRKSLSISILSSNSSNNHNLAFYSKSIKPKILLTTTSELNRDSPLIGNTLHLFDDVKSINVYDAIFSRSRVRDDGLYFWEEEGHTSCSLVGISFILCLQA